MNKRDPTQQFKSNIWKIYVYVLVKNWSKEHFIIQSYFDQLNKRVKKE